MKEQAGSAARSWTISPHFGTPEAPLGSARYLVSSAVDLTTRLSATAFVIRKHRAISRCQHLCEDRPQSPCSRRDLGARAGLGLISWSSLRKPAHYSPICAGDSVSGAPRPKSLEVSLDPLRVRLVLHHRRLLATLRPLDQQLRRSVSIYRAREQIALTKDASGCL
jgi:hypothetical protein